MAEYVIIGAGAAGISAIEAIRELDPEGEILLICEEKDGYYSRPGLAYYLTGEIREDCLYPAHAVNSPAMKVHRLNASARRLDLQNHRVELTNGNQVNYQKLLIATGAKASDARLPGINLQGVIKLDNLDDARRILKMARRRKTAVVVGGGITALELVEGFRARGLKVHYLLRGERYWSNVLDEVESRIVEQRLIEEGIQIHYQTELAEVLGKHGHICGVLTTTGQKINCDVLGVAIGVQPRMALAESSGLKTEKGISVNEYMQTSSNDVFAAGDVAQVYDPVLGRAILDSLWDPARRQGYVAGLNMAGKPAAYSKGIPFNVTRLAGLTTTIIGALGGREADADTVGIVRGDSEAWRQMPDAIAAQSNFKVNRLRVLVGEDRLVGALVMGDQTLSQAIHHLVTEKIDITPIRDTILESGCPIHEVIAAYWADYILSAGRRVYATI